MNLKAKQPTGQTPPLALDVIVPYFLRVKGTKVVVPNINEGWLGKPVQTAEPAVWLSTNQASLITGAYYSANGGFLARY